MEERVVRIAPFNRHVSYDEYFVYLTLATLARRATVPLSTVIRASMVAHHCPCMLHPNRPSAGWSCHMWHSCSMLAARFLANCRSTPIFGRRLKWRLVEYVSPHHELAPTADGHALV